MQKAPFHINLDQAKENFKAMMNKERRLAACRFFLWPHKPALVDFKFGKKGLSIKGVRLSGISVTQCVRCGYTSEVHRFLK